MRKVIVSMNITEDGFLADADHGLDWHFRFWDEEMSEALTSQLSRADTILFGRKTYEAMAGYWPLQMKNPDFPRADLAFADMMNRYRKLVFSQTIHTLRWQNSVCVRVPLEAEVRRLKNSHGRDIVIYGSPSIVDALTPAGLIDEYQLWVHPVRIRQGVSFRFPSRHSKLNFRKRFASGVNLISYRPSLVLK